MNPAGRNLLIGCLLLLPGLALSGENSLLIPAQGRCLLAMPATPPSPELQECQNIAGQGDSEAQYELGEYFYTGQHTGRDLPQAIHWLEKASLQGHARAQLRLGQLFWHGEGVPANRVQAYVVLKMAAVNGSDDALDEADRLEQQMSRDEVHRASRVLGEIFRDYLQELDRLPSAGMPESEDALPPAALAPAQLAAPATPEPIPAPAIEPAASAPVAGTPVESTALPPAAATAATDAPAEPAAPSAEPAAQPVATPR